MAGRLAACYFESFLLEMDGIATSVKLPVDALGSVLPGRILC